uniref:Bidirectional sugar transporter SWEET n=1 Tax=Salix viminalis TaxID=40686 RepID=A0A6N2KYN3_SALVM
MDEDDKWMRISPTGPCQLTPAPLGGEVGFVCKAEIKAQGWVLIGVKEREVGYCLVKEGLMSDSFQYPVWATCKDAAGIAGNIFAFGLFENHQKPFNGTVLGVAVYICTNELLDLHVVRHALISADNLLVVTVNSIGTVFQSAYLILFIIYAEGKTKVSMIALLLGVLGVFAMIVVGSLQIHDQMIRWISVGSLTVVSLISMFASPLFIINLVVRTKSVEFMPFYLSLSTFLMSTSFLLYGVLNFDAFIYVPNGIGTILGIMQLLLYFHFKKKSIQESKEPLIK